ncbi:MAG: sigma-70 family RNA polymerase sigma factor, partial [Planctomycetes bacterium]|nr:sigma-70 family RNA polymerase sigma factor [Planctomycetota bacterium]
MADSPIRSFESLLKHQSWMRGLARSLVLDDASADDVVQAAWSAALESPPQEVAAQSWLSTVVRRLSYRTHRDRERRRRRESTASRPEDAGSVGADESAVRLELQRSVIEAVLDLPEPLRDAVLLRYYEELSSAEIARRLEVPAATIRTRLKRGLDQLRVRLDSEFGDRRCWGLALLPLARLRPSSISTSASATAGARTVEVSSWIGIGSVIMSVQKIAAVVSIAVLAIVAARWGLNSSDGTVDDRVTNDGARNAGLTMSDERTRDRSPLSTGPSLDPVSPGATTAGSHDDDAVESSGLRVTGRVVDDHDRPIGGAEIVLPEPLRSVRTDDHGEYLLELAHFQRYGTYEAIVDAEGYALEVLPVAVEPGARIDAGTTVLRRGASVTGRVVDATGSAVSGAEVRLFLPERTSALEATSGAGGRFTFDRIAARYVELRAFDAERESSERVRVVVEPGPTMRDVEIVILTRVHSPLLRGVVLGPDGNPWPRAQVKAYSEHRITSTDTDRDGAFSIEVDGPESWSLTASARDADQALGGGAEEVFPGGPPTVIRLELGATIDLTFVDPLGNPARPNALVYFRTSSHGGRTSWSADVEPLDASHRFRLRLPVTESAVEVQADRYRDIELGPFLPGRVPSELTVVLAPHPRVHVRVRSGDSAVGDAPVTLHRLRSPDEFYEVNGFPTRFDDASDRDRTDRNGEATLAIDLDDDQIGPSTEFVVRATGSGVAGSSFAPTSSAPFSLGDLERSEAWIELELGPGGAIEGELLLPPGGMRAGRYVAASCGDGEIRTTELGADGSYRFAQLSPGTWIVRETFPALLTSRMGSGRPGLPDDATRYEAWSCEVRSGETTIFDLDLRHQPGFELRGRVQIDGAAPGPWRIQLRPESPIDAILDQYYGSSRLDSDGSFTSSAPRLGRHQLAIAGTDASGRRITIRESVDLVEGAQDWSATWDTGEIRGVLPKTVEGSLTYVQTTGERTVTVALARDEDGAFAGRVPEGPGELVLRDGTGRRILCQTMVGASSVVVLEADDLRGDIP